MGQKKSTRRVTFLLTPCGVSINLPAMEQQTVTPLPWWAAVPPEGFTAYAERQQLPRMQQSREAHQVNGNLIVGIIDRKNGKG